MSLDVDGCDPVMMLVPACVLFASTGFCCYCYETLTAKETAQDTRFAILGVSKIPDKNRAQFDGGSTLPSLQKAFVLTNGWIAV